MTVRIINDEAIARLLKHHELREFQFPLDLKTAGR